MKVPLLVDDFLRRAARVYPEKTAIVDGELRLSYRQFAERADRLSNALLALGVAKGDRVCMLSPNSHFFLESFFGTSRIGAMLVPKRSFTAWMRPVSAPNWRWNMPCQASAVT